MAQALVANSVSQYIELVRDHLGPIEDFERTLWYRGQANAAWGIVPTVLRPWFLEKVRSRSPFLDLGFEEELHELERHINVEFHQSSAWLTGRSGTELTPLVGISGGGVRVQASPVEADFVATYFAAQHHGLPTRLLDWSTNALAALFFATAERDQEKFDGAVVILCPDGLGRTIGGRCVQPATLVAEYSQACQACIARLFRKHSRSGSSDIVPIVPDARVGRILQQGSRFTLHLPGSLPLQERAYRTVRIPAAKKRRIQFDLRAVGITWATLFPDLDHLAMEFKARLGLFPVAPVEPAERRRPVASRSGFRLAVRTEINKRRHFARMSRVRSKGRP